MSRLSEYIKDNRDKVYETANSNTLRDHNNRAVIKSTDEWLQESEWDELYKELSVAGVK